MKTGFSPMPDPGSVVNPTAVRDGKVVSMDWVNPPPSNTKQEQNLFSASLEANYAIVLDEKQAEKYFDWKKTSPNGDFQTFMDSLRKGPLNKENLRSPRSSRILDLRGSNTSAPGALGGSGSGIKPFGKERIEPQTLNISFNPNKLGDLNAPNSSQPTSHQLQQKPSGFSGSLQSIPVQAPSLDPNTLTQIPFLVSAQPILQEPKQINKKTVTLPRPEIILNPSEIKKDDPKTIASSNPVTNDNKPFNGQPTNAGDAFGNSSNPFELLGPYQPKPNPLPTTNSFALPSQPQPNQYFLPNNSNPQLPLPQNFSSIGGQGTSFFGSPSFDPTEISSRPGAFDQVSPYPAPIEFNYNQYQPQQTPNFNSYQQYPPTHNYFEPNQTGYPAYFQQTQPSSAQTIFQQPTTG